jgi:competence protein ComEC
MVGGNYRDLVAIVNSAKKYHIKILPIKRGDIYSFDENTYIKVLYAYDGIHTPVGTTDINDMSVIAMFHDGNNKFLFTGDLNKKLGKYLASHAKDIKADILKFPHHGTEGFAPNDFFDTVSPKVVLVPGPSSLWCSKRSKRARELVKNNNYIAYVNGFHGNVTVFSDGKTYKIYTENKSAMICR